jgi:type II secretory pathway pseudopilin PulG
MHLYFRGDSCKTFRRVPAFTLVEVVVALAIVMAIFGGVLLSYFQSARRAEWSGRSLAAEAQAIQQIELIRSAVWSRQSASGDNNLRDEIQSLPLQNKTTNVISGVTTVSGYWWTNLDIPSSGTNYVPATNWVTIRTLNWPGVTDAVFREVRVDTVWPCSWNGGSRLYTNTVCTYSSPDD